MFVSGTTTLGPTASSKPLPQALLHGPPLRLLYSPSGQPAKPKYTCFGFVVACLRSVPSSMTLNDVYPLLFPSFPGVELFAGGRWLAKLEDGWVCAFFAAPNPARLDR